MTLTGIARATCTETRREVMRDTSPVRSDVHNPGFTGLLDGSQHVWMLRDAVQEAAISLVVGEGVERELKDHNDVQDELPAPVPPTPSPGPALSAAWPNSPSPQLRPRPQRGCVVGIEVLERRAE